MIITHHHSRGTDFVLWTESPNRRSGLWSRADCSESWHLASGSCPFCIDLFGCAKSNLSRSYLLLSQGNPSFELFPFRIPHPSPFSFPTAPSKPYLPSPHLSPITNLFVILTDPPPDFPADTSGAPFMFPARAPLPQATDRPSKEDQFCRLIDKVEEGCQRAADAAMGDTEGFLLDEDDPG